MTTTFFCLYINFYPPDPKWTKVFSHDTSGGLFSGSDVLSKNPKDSSSHLYSVLNTMEDMKHSDGSFHLRLCYPELKGCNEWTQTSNPVTESTITGYKPIKLDFGSFTGLGVNMISDRKNAYIDYLPNTGHWFYAVGAMNYWGGSNTIPGPLGVKNSAVTKVTLSVVKPGNFNIIKEGHSF